MEDLYYKESNLVKRIIFWCLAVLLYYLSIFQFGKVSLYLFGSLFDKGYLGPELFFKHLLLFGSLTSAICCYIFIFMGYKLKILKLPRYRKNFKKALCAGIIGGLVLSLLITFYWYVRDYEFKFDNSLSNILGNIFSNYYEEIGLRGLLVGSSVALFRNKWLGIIIPSLIMTSTHNQYPLEFKIFIFFGSCIFGYVYVYTRNIFSSFSSHQLADMILDTILKI